MKITDLKENFDKFIKNHIRRMPEIRPFKTSRTDHTILYDLEYGDMYIMVSIEPRDGGTSLPGDSLFYQVSSAIMDRDGDRRRPYWEEDENVKVRDLKKYLTGVQKRAEVMYAKRSSAKRVLDPYFS